MPAGRSRKRYKKSYRRSSVRVAGRYRLAPFRTGGFRSALVNGRRRGGGCGSLELKTIDSGVGGSNGLAAGQFSLLNGVATGTDYTSRIGRRICNKSLLYRLIVFPIITASDQTGSVLRVILLWDMQTNAALPAVTDILNTSDVMSPMNLNNRDRFKIIKDQWFCMNAAAYTASVLTGGSPRPVCWSYYKKFANETIFGGVTNAVGSIQSGSMLSLIITSSNNLVAYQISSRVRFTD